MSAARIARRGLFKSMCPLIPVAAQERAFGAPRRRRRATFHTWSIALGFRPKNYQLALRTAREEAGLSPTSSNMRTAHGSGAIGKVA